MCYSNHKTSVMSIILSGKTLKGSGIGKTLGFPTVNIPYSGGISGVFVGLMEMDGKKYRAAVNVGGRPTVDNKKLCEAYLLAFSGDVKVGSLVKIELLKKIREVKKFENLEELKTAIAADVEFAKNCYNWPA